MYVKYVNIWKGHVEQSSALTERFCAGNTEMHRTFSLAIPTHCTE